MNPNLSGGSAPLKPDGSASLKPDGSASLHLDGALTIREAESLHARLAEAVRAQSALVLDCGAAREVDLSFVQLVIAARRSAEALGHTLRLAAPATGPLRDALSRGGFLEPGESEDGASGDPFWTTGSFNR